MVEIELIIKQLYISVDNISIGFINFRTFLNINLEQATYTTLRQNDSTEKKSEGY